jgi:tetratricopeptide (TPR) repeat protein
MRRAVVLLLALSVAGCRSDVRYVRFDVTRIARLVRAYGSSTARSLPRLDVAHLPPERLNDLGVMLERRGILDRAEEYYRMAVERKPDFARAWVNLGNVLRQRGRDNEAADCYRRAMKEDPALFEAINNFADLCADTGEGVEQALDLLWAAVEKHPSQEAVGRDTLGKLWLRGGRPAQAVEALRTALGLTDPRETALAAAILQHLAQAHHMLGQEDAARSAELRAAALM